MAFILFKRDPGRDACARWTHAPETSSSAGPPDGILDHHEREVRLPTSETLDSAFQRLRAQLLSYDIFPTRFLRFVVCPQGQLAVGSIIVQRIGFGPVALESAVRVVDVWNRLKAGEQQAGFRYVTLAGHPERGTASFEVRVGRDGKLIVVLESQSLPGSLAFRLARPIARSIQLSITRAAIRRLAKS